MIRNLKVLFAAALALTALGAIAASAQGADEFHCSVNPCRLTLKTDGTGLAAHHVLIIETPTTSESASLTCESLRGEGEFVGNTTNDITFAWTNTISEPNRDREAYDNCKVNGAPGAIVHMNSCKYTFTAGPEGRTGTATLHILCNAGDAIQITVPSTTCVFTIGPQTLGAGGGGGGAGGAGYASVGTSPNREITLTMNMHGIVVTKDGNCLPLFPGNPPTLTGTYTTGSTLITGETIPGVMADAWFE